MEDKNINTETDERLTEEDLLFSGRKANKELGNFRLFGKSKHQQYYTLNELAEVIFKMLRPVIDKEGNIQKLSVLDPTCGSGRLLVPWKKAKAKVLGIELDKEAALVAKRLIGKENIRVGDILDYAEHLSNFNIVVSNPPYGLRWQVSERSFSFDCECYGGSIESQAATIEIITQALDHNGILVTIIPTTTFTNAKDKKLREHLYQNYNVLLRATLANVFKKEYNIDVKVDLVIAQKEWSYNVENSDVKKIELDLIKDQGWQQTLVQLMHQIISEKEIEITPSKSSYVPFLDMLNPIPIENSVSITAKGLSGDISSLAMLDFHNKVLKEYNPIQGIPTGIIDAYLSPSTLIKRGIDAAKEMLNVLGFEVSINEKDLAKIQRLKKKYDFLCTPIYRPKSHQLLAYFFDQEYEAKATVKDNDSKVLFKKGKKYALHPTWVRHREVAKIQEAYDERKKKEVTITTEMDRGYLSIKVETEQGEHSFDEINVEDVKLFTEAFPLPEIKDLADKYPDLVEKNRKAIDHDMAFLFDYQREDIARLALKNFGYIGYDMGGGKTVCAASWSKLRGYKQVLVICQSGLIKNWLNELEKFGFSVHRLTTHRTIDKLLESKRAGIKNAEPVFYVTSYEFLSLDIGRVYDPWDCIEYDKDGNVRRATHEITSEKCPDCGKAFNTVLKECPKCKEHDGWTGNVCLKCGYRAYTYSSKKKIYPAYKRMSKLFSAVVVDEAQLAKTKNSGRGRAVRAMKSKGRLLLTGTLMKGYITDIYFNVGYLLRYDNPLFHYRYVGGSKQFLNEFGTFEYVTKQFEDTLSEGRAKLIPEVSNLNRFWRILASFTVRRLKDEMIELPAKHRHVLLLPMDPEHEQLYNEYQDWATNVIANALAKASETGEVNMGIISAALWKLRFSSTVPTASSYLCKEPGPQISLQTLNGWNKVNKVVELVKQIKAKGEKVIIFSGLRPMVSAISKSLKTNDIGFVPILATHKANQRFEMIEQFSNNGATAIVAGLNVLNRGFTITAANNVIITDLEYSPEATLQAEDRSHRTGQEKEVNVYYLFSSGTIDEVMFELISKKQEAISNAIDAKAKYTDVAKLLEDRTGNIQLEVAKRIVERAPLRERIERIEPKKEDLEITGPEVIEKVSPVTLYESSRNNLWEELYQQKLEWKNSQRRKKKQVSSGQIGLFG